MSEDDVKGVSPDRDTGKLEHLHDAHGLPPDPDEGLSEEEKARIVSADLHSCPCQWNTVPSSLNKPCKSDRTEARNELRLTSNVPM